MVAASEWGCLPSPCHARRLTVMLSAVGIVHALISALPLSACGVQLEAYLRGEMGDAARHFESEMERWKAEVVKMEERMRVEVAKEQAATEAQREETEKVRAEMYDTMAKQEEELQVERDEMRAKVCGGSVFDLALSVCEMKRWWWGGVSCVHNGYDPYLIPFLTLP